MAYSYEYEMSSDVDQEMVALAALRGEEYAHAILEIVRRLEPVTQMSVARFLYWAHHREAGGYNDTLVYLQKRLAEGF
jgi:hypothetical protein